MDWDDAKYFLAIAREGQMLAAAQRLGVSQARLSRRLQSLEDAVSTRLFDRSTRGCTLTDEGQAFLETAERVEAAFIEGAARLAETTDGVSGTIRIGAPDGLGSAYLAKNLGDMLAAFPHLKLQLVPLPRNFSLSEREADIAIMIGRPVKGRLRAKLLTDYSLGLYAGSAYLRQHQRPETLTELRAHRLIGYVDDLIYTPELHYADEFLREWRSDIAISTAIGQLEAVRSGAGIGILHDFMTGSVDGLIRLFPETRAVRSYWAVWHENLGTSRRVAAVVAALERLVRKDRALFMPFDR